MKRESIGKRLRFDIFKRDAFTCQYCGAQPPNVVLVIDHVNPVANGGGNEEMNLVAACEACNAGKGAKSLAHVPIRPDADLLYLETQQELAELRRFQISKTERDEARSQVVDSLQASWCDCSGLDWCPQDHVLLQLISRYSPIVVLEAVEYTAPKVAEGYVGRNKWVQYLWSICRNKEAEGG